MPITLMPEPGPIIVVPTYNESETLPTLVSRVLAQGDDLQLIIVDDASPDGTGALADDLAQQHPGRIEVLHRTAKDGIGPAYIAGFRRALSRTPIAIVQMDADLSHDPADIPRLLAALADADLALGSRYTAGGGTAGWSAWRRLMSEAGCRYARAVIGIPIADLTGGFKAWRPETLARLDLDHIAADGYGFQIETTVRAHRAGARVVEVPITFHERLAGQSKISRRIVAEAAVLVWRLR